LAARTARVTGGGRRPRGQHIERMSLLLGVDDLLHLGQLSMPKPFSARPCNSCLARAGAAPEGRGVRLRSRRSPALAEEQFHEFGAAEMGVPSGCQELVNPPYAGCCVSLPSASLILVFWRLGVVRGCFPVFQRSIGRIGRHGTYGRSMVRAAPHSPPPGSWKCGGLSQSHRIVKVVLAVVEARAAPDDLLEPQISPA